MQSEAKIQAAKETIVKQQRTIVAQKQSKEIFKVMVIEARKSACEARAQAKVNVDAAKKSAYASSLKCEQIEMKMANEVNKAVDKAVMKEEVRTLEISISFVLLMHLNYSASTISPWICI